MATFSAEVTPPMGHACMAGGIAPAQRLIDPLWCHGLVLLGGEKPVVLAAIDWCEIRNDAYDQWRDALAEAAGTVRTHVFFACVHQHDTPVADLTAQRLLDEAGLPNALCDVPFHEAAVKRVAAAVRVALDHAQPVTHYGVGEAEVQELASNRRVERADGAVGYPRMSATPDPEVRAAPAGEIDPKLKALSFWNVDTPVAAIYVYAVHPMSFYGKGGVSADFPGLARQLRLAAAPNVHQIYFSGCSGDVVAGKWNDGAPENRLVLAKKIFDAMMLAWERSEKYPIEAPSVRVAHLVLPVKETKDFTEAEMKAILADPRQKTFQRILAAMGLSWRKRVASGQPIDVPALDLGAAKFLLMPAESFVGYQLMAQQLLPEKMVLVAGYGECAPGYIPTAAATAEHFNDDQDWCWVGPGAEEAMRTAMTEALGR
ncbi:MAG: hypothetical protein HYV26_16115 [Candidatus Hydrogenedentes bacterium]|nr:hypothetical protein [Candidatus Hydrogenedentota bacterium]